MTALAILALQQGVARYRSRQRAARNSPGNVMSNETMQNAGADAAEKKEKYTGKIAGGLVGGAIGGAIGGILLGAYAIFPIAVMVGVLGVGLGSVFD
jgi:hypothetical protein